MKPWLTRLPALLALALGGALIAYGPIAQPANYHAFADTSVFLGIPHAADVLSNAGFAVVGLWGWRRLHAQRSQPALAAGWAGWRLFLAGLVLTAAGSAFYHLSPDNWRLLWDRFPIAVACAGLLVAVRAETRRQADCRGAAAGMALFAVTSVAWWHFTGLDGEGDLRPYLLLQILPIILIPLWQAIHHAPAADRRSFGAALLIYIAARFAEVYDHELLALLGFVSGHTLKHLLATAAAALIVVRLARRIEEAAVRAGTDAPPSGNA